MPSADENRSLEGILTRAQDGVHENANFHYHGHVGLVEVLRRKELRKEFFCLQGLNQARKLLGMVAELSEHKRLVTAIAHGSVERVDRIIRIAVSQKRGIRGILSTYEAAAQGVYHPKNFTEEDDMRALLQWRLGGNRIANINHRAREDPSLTYLRSLSFTPPIIPSPGQPTEDEVSRNVKAAFKTILAVAHGQQ